MTVGGSVADSILVTGQGHRVTVIRGLLIAVVLAILAAGGTGY